MVRVGTTEYYDTPCGLRRFDAGALAEHLAYCQRCDDILAEAEAAPR